MRHFFLTAIALGFVAVGIATSPAQARDYPFCIKGHNYDSSVGDCSFDTYQQCQAAASGRYAFCDRNPYFAPVSQPPAKPDQRGRRQ